ncbi:MAG TPA: CoA ester lyase [Candidatus Acidoferrales bacterium]|nr:CoA ester lyase [Candidatus Acidoferrales bacterium]
MSLRSLLFVPANDTRRVEKALSSEADAVVLDLEDAVAIREKPAARERVVETLCKPRQSLLYVRINDMGTQFCYRDVVSIARAGLDGILLPVVESAAQLQGFDWFLSQVEADNDLPVNSIDLIPYIETAKGLAAVNEIACYGKRIRQLAFGAGDFTTDMGIAWTHNESELGFARSSVAVASRASGLEAPIDTVWTGIRDMEGFEASARLAAAAGFGGKMCIHPEQVRIANRVFAPSAEQIANAERIIEAFATAESAGSAAILVDGRFVDYTIVEHARRVLDSVR